MEQMGGKGGTISGHAQLEALLEAAELASVPVDAVHEAGLVPGALVVGDAALRAPEEALAALACDHPVVPALPITLPLCPLAEEKRAPYTPLDLSPQTLQGITSIWAATQSLLEDQRKQWNSGSEV